MIIGVFIGMALMAPLTLISVIGWFGGDRDQRAAFNRRATTRTAAERRARRRLGLS